MMNALFAIVILAAFFAGFGYMQLLASRCPGKQTCDGEPRSAGCSACGLAEGVEEDGRDA